MQNQITFAFVIMTVCSLTAGKPQTNFNNYPYRPTFSDLDPNYYYTTTSPYQQNVVRIWPYIIDQAVSPLYNWNWNSNGYNNGYNGYNGNNGNNGYNGYTGYNWFNNGYNTNNNNGYYNAYTTNNPYLSVYNPYGTTYTGKK